MSNGRIGPPWWLMARGTGGYRTKSGSIVEIDDAAVAQVKGLLVNIDPVQDLHGYALPWAPGWGKNLFDCPTTASTSDTGTLTPNGDGSITIEATAGNVACMWYAILPRTIPAGTNVTISLNNSDTNSDVLVRLLKLAPGESGTQEYGTACLADSVNKVLTVNQTFDAHAINVAVKTVHSAVSPIVLKVQVEIGNSATAWASYSNICPISGWSAVDLFRETAYDPDADPYIPITIPTPPGTVYGGYISVAEDGSAELVVAWVSETVTSTNYVGTFTNRLLWLVSQDTYAPKPGGQVYSDRFGTRSWATGHTWSDSNSGNISLIPVDQTLNTKALADAWLAENPTQIVFELEEPITYPLSDITVRTLAGQNVMWADCGEISVEYLSKSGNPALVALALAHRIEE